MAERKTTNINLQNSTQETKDLKIAQHEPHHLPLVAPVVLLLIQSR